MHEASSEAPEPIPKGRVPRAEREQQIVGHAAAVFARRGFEAASMEEIARASGVDRALVYQYFGGKRELYEACYQNAVEGVTKRVNEALTGIGQIDDSDEARDALLRTGVRAFFESVRENGDAWNVLIGAGWVNLGLTDDGEASAGVDMVEWVEQLLALTYPLADRIEIRTCAVHLLGASWAISLWWRRDASLTLDEITEHHVRFCKEVLGPLEQQSAQGVDSSIAEAG